jgi:hypothetical protein
MHLLLDARDLPPTVSSLSLVHGHLDTRHDITHTSHTTVQHCPRQRNLRAESNAKQTDATIHTDDEDTGYHACNVATRHETVNECSNAAQTQHDTRFGIPLVYPASCVSRFSLFALMFALPFRAPLAHHTELVARPFPIAYDRTLPADAAPKTTRHGSAGPMPRTDRRTPYLGELLAYRDAEDK